MFKRILVATDLTPSTRISLRAAFDLARHDQGEVILVHVVRRIASIPDRELRAFYARLKADARLRMHDLTSWFTRERGVDIACELTIGAPAREIVRIARVREVDLVVLSHADAGEGPPLGSISYKIAHLAPCAVLILKGRPASRASATRKIKRRA